MNAPTTFAHEIADLDPSDFATLAALVHRETGILLPEAKRELVRSRLARRLRIHGLAAFRDYLVLIGKDAEEKAAALDALTTNHTSFFREQHHFDHFAAEVRPGLLRRAQAGERLRFWSAACSSGEEPYTFAMTLLGPDRGVGMRVADTDTIILATDISPTVIKRAQAARYTSATVQSVPAPLASTWLDHSGDHATIDPVCAGMVRFRELNLMGAWPIKTMFDAIFCRNVMIYFDDPTKARLQQRLVERLAPGGFLYIGHSERLIGAAADQCRAMGQTIYRKERA